MAEDLEDLIQTLRASGWDTTNVEVTVAAGGLPVSLTDGQPVIVARVHECDLSAKPAVWGREGDAASLVVGLIHDGRVTHQRPAAPASCCPTYATD